MKTTEEKKKELLDLVDLLNRAHETSSDGHMPLIEVKKLLEKMGLLYQEPSPCRPQHLSSEKEQLVKKKKKMTRFI